MSVVLLYRVQWIYKTCDWDIYHNLLDQFAGAIYHNLLDQKLINFQPAGTNPSWASALTTQNHSGSSCVTEKSISIFRTEPSCQNHHDPQNTIAGSILGHPVTERVDISLRHHHRQDYHHQNHEKVTLFKTVTHWPRSTLRSFSSWAW